MDRRSPKSPVLYERYKSGCAWGLLKLCDFREDHSNSKLVSNSKGLNTHVADDRFTKNRFDLLSSFEEKSHYIDDGVESKTLTSHSDKLDKTRIKEEEMATDKQMKNKITDNRADVSDSQPTRHVPTRNRKKVSKTFQMHGCKDIATLGSYENSAKTSSKKSNKATLNEASCNGVHPKKGRDSSCRSVSPRKLDQMGEIELQLQMNEAAELFINQKFIKGRYLGRDRTNHQSKHFLDALEILNSNKDLFMKLLQDPNSLLAKHIQDLRDCHANEQETKSFSEAKNSDNCGMKCEYSSKGNADPQPSDTIVVLKPDLTSMQDGSVKIRECSSPHSLYSLRNKEQNGKPAYFSFEHMKRKLRHAIGLKRKEKLSTSTDIPTLGDGGKGKSLEVAESNMESKINLGNVRTSKSSPEVNKIDKTGKAMDFESGIKRQVVLNSRSGNDSSNLSMVRHLKQRESNMYVESRRHLAEILRIRNEQLARKQEVKTLTLPEYDFLSTLSPGKYRDHGSIATQMRFSPYSGYQVVNEHKQRLRRELENKYLSSLRQTVGATPWTDNKSTDQLQTFHEKPNIPQSHFSDIKTIESTGSRDMQCPRGYLKSVETISSNQSATAITGEENGYLEQSKSDSSMENFTPPTAKDTDGMEGKVKHLSPVSVLDQFLEEDVISTRFEPAEPVTEPKEVSYEEHYSTSVMKHQEDLQINSSNAMDEHESMSKYVTALLQVSGINWDELSMKCCLTEQILEPSLFDLVEALPDQSSADARLLFDYINEVLLEVHHCFHSCSPWISLFKPKVQPFLLSLKNVDCEVMKCVNWDLLSHGPSLKLDQLVEKDLAKSGTWMDTRIDTESESAISEVVDSILQELTLETAIDLNT